MGTILFLIIVVLLGFFFYLQDTKNIRTYLYIIFYTHFSKKNI